MVSVCLCLFRRTCVRSRNIRSISQMSLFSTGPRPQYQRQTPPGLADESAAVLDVLYYVQQAAHMHLFQSQVYCLRAMALRYSTVTLFASSMMARISCTRHFLSVGVSHSQARWRAAKYKSLSLWNRSTTSSAAVFAFRIAGTGSSLHKPAWV